LATFDGLRKDLRAAAYEIVRLGGARGTVTSVRRSRRQQELLWRRFQQGLSQFPAAPPGSSTHEKGLAFDYYSKDAELLKALGHLWESWGGRWGGRFNDPIHFDVPPPPAKKKRARR
jgi:hypothetical protein